MPKRPKNGHLQHVLSQSLKLHFETSGEKIDAHAIVLALADFTRHVLDIIQENDAKAASELQFKAVDAIQCLGRPSVARTMPTVDDFDGEFLAHTASRKSASTAIVASRDFDVR